MSIKIKHKDIKKCAVVMSVLQKQHNMPKGALVKLKTPLILSDVASSIDENNVLRPYKQSSSRPKLFPKGTVGMFLGVVYDPVYKFHFLAFLIGNKVWGMQFVTGITIPRLRKTFDILVAEKHDTAKDQQNSKLAFKGV